MEAPPSRSRPLFIPPSFVKSPSFSGTVSFPTEIPKNETQINAAITITSIEQPIILFFILFPHFTQKDGRERPSSVFCSVFDVELFLESVNASARIDQFLFTGEEGVALGTDFNANIVLRRTRRNFVSADAFDDGFFVLGMYSVFHLVSS